MYLITGRVIKSTIGNPMDSNKTVLKNRTKSIFGFIVIGFVVLMHYLPFANMNEAKAQITTTASIMFQNSLRYEPGCKITPRSIICNNNTSGVLY